jgi:hypothetical protein
LCRCTPFPWDSRQRIETETDAATGIEYTRRIAVFRRSRRHDGERNDPTEKRVGRPRRRSAAAVDRQHLAGDEGGRRTREEFDGAEHVRRGAESAESRAPRDPQPVFLGKRRRKVGFQEARGDRVDADAAGAQFVGRLWPRPSKAAFVAA